VAVTIGPEPISSPDARALITELDALLNDLYPPEDNFLDLPASDVDGRSGVFLVAREERAAIGCGAVRKISPTTGEVKRMYVIPRARGTGVGRAVLESLEAWARREGLSTLVLETGPAQRDALKLYQAAGFGPIPCFGPYRDAAQSICLEKHLTAQAGGVLEAGPPR
jgi:putative acetyltransferase